MKHSTRFLLAALATAPSAAALACATCGCSLSADAAMGYSSSTGWTASLQYDYLDQSQLRSGTHAVSQAQVAAINNAGGSQEVENGTLSRYTTLGIGYAPSPDWNFKLAVPFLDRSHSTYGDSPNPLTPDLLSSASYTGLGDARFIASYQGLLPTNNLGVQLGIKLPTGDYGGPAAGGIGVVGRNPKPFTSGPLTGNLVDTSLQPGTGSTDLIVGAYYYQPISQNFDAFINGQFQAAVSQKLDQAGADFRPGNLATVSFGTRYEANPDIVPQLQVNITRKSHDQGALADTTDSAGTVVYLSPGVTVNAGHDTHVYAFLQLPVYSNLQGYQLFPRWTASVGLMHAF
ncbi:MAG TPA: transporter [Variovorax sp.]